ncbi:hypothetical protein BRARA_A00671 [Brassica rapa]|uniref:Uncharacterized protein n=1 Tax=Brassica campestris TaxID=3711 RepID=A0A398AQ94_BRACM|nr:hypothetical protein BRARA_A00671 [Brassica rapa]
MNRFFTAAFYDPDYESSSLEIQSLDPNSNPLVESLSSWTSPSRVSPLETTGKIRRVCDDGRVNVVTVVNGEGLRYRRVFDGNGLLGYRAVKWASSSEFVTGGYGFGLQLWDQRKGGEAVSQLKGNWFQGKTFAVVHSIDIHPSRKHTCIAGGSSGTVFAWDLRWPKQPIVLSGVWEVQYDSDTKSNISSSSRILPVMTCSEDGILGVIEQGEEPIELLAEPCAINSFDIDRQNPQDVICSLEWESIAIFSRP